jgi:hypothetical protein
LASFFISHLATRACEFTLKKLKVRKGNEPLLFNENYGIREGKEIPISSFMSDPLFWQELRKRGDKFRDLHSFDSIRLTLSNPLPGVARQARREQIRHK